jgi:hypothetical protein
MTYTIHYKYGRMENKHWRTGNITRHYRFHIFKIIALGIFWQDTRLGTLHTNSQVNLHRFSHAEMSTLISRIAKPNQTCDHFGIGNRRIYLNLDNTHLAKTF